MIWEWWNIPELVEVRDNFFHTEKVLFDLDELIPQDNTRKVEFNLRNQTWLPKKLSHAIEFICDETRTAFTTAILKDYWPEKNSAAYRAHADPARFIHWPLWLLTLRWEADFHLWDKENNKHDYEAIPNRMMLVNPYLTHQVGRPKNFWYRSLLFVWVET